MSDTPSVGTPAPPQAIPARQDPSSHWLDQEFVASWMRNDRNKEFLVFPRNLTAAIVADDAVDPRLIIDIASGPGHYLSVMLAQFPGARGVWTDSSSAMLAVARTTLEPFADRVEHQIVDMKSLATSQLPTADVIVTSRAAHHLTREELFDFYSACLGKLEPAGWLANLDHTQAPGAWKERYKRVRKQGREPQDGPQLPRHTHEHPPPTIAEHLEGMTAAGFTDVELVWKAYHTCLFMGRKPAATT